MKKTSLLVLIVFGVCLSNAAYANHHEESKPMDPAKCEGMTHGNFSISALDANKDGAITKSEYLGNKSNSEKTFKHIDANGDGKLDKTEQTDIEAVYKAMHQAIESKSISM